MSSCGLIPSGPNTTGERGRLTARQWLPTYHTHDILDGRRGHLEIRDAPFEKTARVEEGVKDIWFDIRGLDGLGCGDGRAVLGCQCWQADHRGHPALDTFLPGPISSQFTTLFGKDGLQLNHSASHHQPRGSIWHKPGQRHILNDLNDFNDFNSLHVENPPTCPALSPFPSAEPPHCCVFGPNVAPS